MRSDDHGVKYRNFYKKPPYYIYGGMVFSVLTDDLVFDLARREANISNFLYYADGPGRFAGRKNVVVLLYVLPDEVNVGYHDLELEVIKEVNGTPVDSLEDLALSIEDNQGEWNVIQTEEKSELIFNREKVKEAEPRILEHYKIAAPYSDDIKGVLSSSL